MQFIFLFFYGPYFTGHDDDMKELFDSRTADTIPQLYFRGYLWDFRKKMVENISDDSVLILDKNNNNNLNYIDYLKDMTQYRCALSLPGGTEICNRDIECFGIGIPVIRPYIDINYPDPLISNYHYINCYGDCKYWDGNPSYISYDDFKNNLLNCWSRVKDNLEYLNFVANNARQWYIKNCSIVANIDYILNQINLEIL